jgi:hypothetical protein
MEYSLIGAGARETRQKEAHDIICAYADRCGELRGGVAKGVSLMLILSPASGSGPGHAFAAAN